MRIFIQQVDKCEVYHYKELIRQINEGTVIYIGLECIDTQEHIDKCTKWIIDYITANDKDVLLLSQFTLFASFKKHHPSFHKAMKTDKAKEIFYMIVERIRNTINNKVESGIFGEYLEIVYKSTNLNSHYIDFYTIKLTE